MTDLGTDLSCVDDLDEMFSLVSGRTALIQAIARRLITRRGALGDEDPNYGLDLIEWIGESVGALELFELRRGVEDQCLQDERVLSATATLTFTEAPERVLVELRLEDDSGPFTLVVSIDEVTVEFLEAA